MESYSPEAEAEGAIEVPAKADLITHVAVGPHNVHDGWALAPVLADTRARAIQPKVLLADSHYGSDDNVAKAAGQEIELVAPAMPLRAVRRRQMFDVCGMGPYREQAVRIARRQAAQ